MTIQIIHEKDNGAIFLKYLKESGIINYVDEAVAHVNTWKHPINGVEYKNWFDTLHEPLIVNLSRSYKNNHDFLFRLSNSKLVLYTKKYAIAAIVKTWKIICAIFVFLLGCYLSSGDHFDKLVAWIKCFFKIK